MAAATVTRSFALDAARGFAVTAMVIAHTVPYIQGAAPRPVVYAESILNDLAAPLFALIIGITIALTSSTAHTARSRRRYQLQTAAKATVLIVLGIVLGLRYSGVAIVLDYLGVTLVAAIPFLFLSTRTLLIVAAAMTAASPILVGMLRTAAHTDPTWAHQPWLVTTVLDWVALGWSYRVAGLLPLYLLGIALGRLLFERKRFPVRSVILASMVVFAAAEAWRSSPAPRRRVATSRCFVTLRWQWVPLSSSAVSPTSHPSGSGRLRGARSARSRPWAPWRCLSMSCMSCC